MFLAIKNITQNEILYHFLFLIFMPILQVFFLFFFSSFNDIQIWAWPGAAICTKNKLTYVIKKTKQKNCPLCFDVIAKCYKRHRFLPSATLWALNILPQWHLCLPFTRIIHRYSESVRQWKDMKEEEKKRGKWQQNKSDPTVAKLSITGCVLANKQGRKSKCTHTNTSGKGWGWNVWEKERLALCSANSQIVLRRSKAECDREGLHTLIFNFFFLIICLKLPLTLPCFV